MAKNTSKTRNWNIIVYPDSAPQNWRDIIDDMHIEWVESPCHDKDVNPDGELKKAHYHVTLLFAGPKSYNQILEICEQLNCPIPKACGSARASVRYMAHLDHPDKYQYSVNDIVAHGGVDLTDLLRKTASERYELIGEMMDFIKLNKIVEFQDLCDYSRCERMDDWFPLLCDNSAIIIKNYISSFRHRNTPERIQTHLKDDIDIDMSESVDSECID